MKKYDKGKNRLDLLPFDALDSVGEVLTFGAEKYEPNSWQGIENSEDRYTAALLRHLSKHKQGEIIDCESGLPHLSHVACNALFLVSVTQSNRFDNPELLTDK